MSEKDAEKIWQLIQASFNLANAENVFPDEDELMIFENYHKGDADYQPSISQADLLKQLDLSDED